MLTIKELVEKTKNAYSVDRYNSWSACIRQLRKIGCNDLEIEAILCSKWTRWAADRSNNVYGKASGLDLIRYINQFETRASIEKLTKEHVELI